MLLPGIARHLVSQHIEPLDKAMPRFGRQDNVVDVPLPGGDIGVREHLPVLPHEILWSGFLYLVAVIDWKSRKVLSHRVSNTLDADFCVAALEEAIGRYGAPEVFNTGQGAQFTSEAFTGALKARGVRISMDGKGRWLDNVYVERFWRSLKQEEVYRHAYETVAKAKKGIAAYVRYFNEERPHQGLDNLTPDDVYYRREPLTKAA